MRLSPIGVAVTTLFASSLANAETVVEYSDRPMRYESSWNLMAGAVGGEDFLLGELGFSQVSASYNHSVGRKVTLGGMVGFDYSYWVPEDRPYDLGAAFILGMPIRIGLHEESKFGFSMRIVPGLYLGFDQRNYDDQFIPGISLDFGVSGGARLRHGFVVGGGVDIPLLIGFPTEYGRDVFLAVPILIGPMAEWHFHPDLAVTADLKFGPHIMTDDFYGTRFGARFLVGLAYRL